MTETVAYAELSWPEAEQRVAQGVRENISVGVAYGTFVEGEFDSTNNQFAAFGESMEVVADPAAIAHDFFCTACFCSTGSCSAWR